MTDLPTVVPNWSEALAQLHAALSASQRCPEYTHSPSEELLAYLDALRPACHLPPDLPALREGTLDIGDNPEAANALDLKADLIVRYTKALAHLGMGFIETRYQITGLGTMDPSRDQHRHELFFEGLCWLTEVLLVNPLHRHARTTLRAFLKDRACAARILSQLREFDLPDHPVRDIYGCHLLGETDAWDTPRATWAGLALPIPQELAHLDLLLDGKSQSRAMFLEALLTLSSRNLVQLAMQQVSPKRNPATAAVPPIPEVLTVSEAAAHYRVSEPTIRRWIDKGLPHLQANQGTIRLRPTEIESFLRKTRNQSHNHKRLPTAAPNHVDIRGNRFPL